MSSATATYHPPAHWPQIARLLPVSEKPMPALFRDLGGGLIACPHDADGCCPKCAYYNQEVCEVDGGHRWVRMKSDRVALGVSSKYPALNGCPEIA